MSHVRHERKTRAEFKLIGNEKPLEECLPFNFGVAYCSGHRRHDILYVSADHALMALEQGSWSTHPCVDCLARIRELARPLIAEVRLPMAMPVPSDGVERDEE